MKLRFLPSPGRRRHLLTSRNRLSLTQCAARCEDLEPRRLLANYSLTVLADLDSTEGDGTAATPVLDAQGDLFDVAELDGPSGYGSLFELTAGQHTAHVVKSYNAFTSEPNRGNLVADKAGDIFGDFESGGTDMIGSIYEIPHGGTINPLFYSFPASPSPPPNGSVPDGELILHEPAFILNGQGLGLDLFGMTDQGGLYGTGTIFQISDILSVTGQAIVNFPAGRPNLGTALVRDASGNIFGTFTNGGTTNQGAIFEAPAGGGVLLTPAEFNGTNGEGPIGPLLQDENSSGFFGTTLAGGDKNDGTLYKFDGSTITTLVNFNGTNGAQPESALMQDAQGNLFGTTVGGGVNNAGTVFELPVGSSTIKTLLSFDGQNNGETPYGGVVADSAGNLFGVTYAGGPFADGVIYELSPPPPTQVGFVSHAPSELIGQTLPPVTVNVEDADGNPIFRDNSDVTVALTGRPDGAILNGTLTVKAVNGVATFDDLSIATAGSYTLSATDGSLTTAVSNSLTIFPPPAQLKFVLQPQGAIIGQTLPTVSVEVDDAGGNVVAIDSSTVTLALAGGAGLSGTLSVNAVNGVASFSDLSFTTPGDYTLSATDSALTVGASNSFTISPPPPRISFAQQPTGVLAGVKLAPPPVVNLLGSDGSVQTTSRPTKVTIVTTDPTNKALRFIAVSKKGVATFRNILFKIAGTYTLQASGGTFVQGNSNTFTVAPATAKKIAFTMPPVSVAHATPFVVQAELFDQFGNLATNNNSTATIGFVGKPKLATLGGATPVIVSAGLATFSDLSIDTPDKAYMLRLTDEKLRLTSKKFAVT